MTIGGVTEPKLCGFCVVVYDGPGCGHLQGCTNVATHTSCGDGDVCEGHRCRCSKPLGARAQPLREEEPHDAYTLIVKQLAAAANERDEARERVRVLEEALQRIAHNTCENHRETAYAALEAK